MTRYRMADTGYQIPDAGFWILDTIVNDIEKSHCEERSDVAISRDCLSAASSKPNGFAGARNDMRTDVMLINSFTIDVRYMEFTKKRHIQL